MATVKREHGSDVVTKTWFGRPVEEMTKDELIVALETMCRLYRESLDRHAAERKVL